MLGLRHRVGTTAAGLDAIFFPFLVSQFTCAETPANSSGTIIFFAAQAIQTW